MASTTCTLTINIDPFWTSTWPTKNIKLCIGAAVYGKRRYVITKVVDIASSPISFQWSDVLSVAAVDEGFRSQYVFKTANDDWTNIQYEDVASFEKSKADGKWTCEVKDNGRGPVRGIGFQNKNAAATCILGRPTWTLADHSDAAVRPVYVSPVLLPPSGHGFEKISIDNSVIVWFDVDPKDGQMIDVVEQAARSLPKDGNTRADTGSTKPPPDFRTKYRFSLLHDISEIWFDKDGYWQSRDPALSEIRDHNSVF